MNCFQLPNFKQQVKVEENLFDYKITFSSILPQTNTLKGGKKIKDEIVRYDSNLFRAKSKLLDYAKNNKFNYFITITIDDKKYDLENYEVIRKVILKYFNNFKNRYDNEFKYILVAELGSKNKRLHFHGLVNLSNTRNLKHIRNGIYRDMKLFDTLGANQFKKIKDYDIACALYISKYIQKDNTAVNLYSRYYFCSKGLKTSKNITYLFTEKSLEELFLYCCSCGLLSNGLYADTIVVTRDFLVNYLVLKNDFEKVLA